MDGWCKIRKAADYAGVSDRTLEDWIRQGLKVSRLPTGTRLIKYQWIDDFLERYAQSNNHVDKMVEEIMAKI